MKSQLNLIVNGVLFTQFTKVVIDKSLDDLCGTFSFDVVDSTNRIFPLKVGDSVTATVNDIAVITGFIDSIEGRYTAGSHMLHVKGRDLSLDLVDSKMGALSFTSNITLEDIIKRVISHLGITDLKVVNEVRDLKPYTQDELDNVTVKHGKSAFKFIEMYARKRQVLITTDNLGTITITRNFNRKLNGHVINELNNDANTVLEGTFKYDDSHRFNKYVFRSQENPVAIVFVSSIPEKGATTTAPKMASQVSEATDNAIRVGRVYEKITESSSTEGIIKDRATWEGNIRRARGISYMPIVQGFFANQDGEIWQLNRLIQVSDDFADISNIMLINRVKFEYGLERGSRTILGLVDKDAYKLQLEIDKTNQKDKAGSLGNIYFKSSQPEEAIREVIATVTS